MERKIYWVNPEPHTHPGLGTIRFQTKIFFENIELKAEQHLNIQTTDSKKWLGYKILFMMKTFGHITAFHSFFKTLHSFGFCSKGHKGLSVF